MDGENVGMTSESVFRMICALTGAPKTPNITSVITGNANGLVRLLTYVDKEWFPQAWLQSVSRGSAKSQESRSHQQMLKAFERNVPLLVPYVASLEKLRLNLPSTVQFLLPIVLVYLVTSERPRKETCDNIRKMPKDDREELASFIAEVFAATWQLSTTPAEKKNVDRKLAKTMKFLGLPEQWAKCSQVEVKDYAIRMFVARQQGHVKAFEDLMQATSDTTTAGDVLSDETGSVEQGKPSVAGVKVEEPQEKQALLPCCHETRIGDDKLSEKESEVGVPLDGNGEPASCVIPSKKEMTPGGDELAANAV